MTTSQHRSNIPTKPRVSALLVMVVMFAILLKASIPLGFMPNLQTNDTFKIVICTIGGAKTLEVDGDYNPLHKSDNKKEHSKEAPCQFSINTAFVDVPALSHSLPSVVFFDAEVVLSEYRVHSYAFFFGNASSQSPPLYFYV